VKEKTDLRMSWRTEDTTTKAEIVHREAGCERKNRFNNTQRKERTEDKEKQLMCCHLINAL